MDKHSRVIEDSVQTVQIRGKQHVIGNTFVSARLDINENVREKQKSNNVSLYLSKYTNYCQHNFVIENKINVTSKHNNIKTLMDAT